MERDYTKIECEFAETGFFSEYLPQCFKLDKKVFLRTPPENCDLIPPLCFTMSRYNNNNARRNIFIPEIGSYIVTSNYIKGKNIIKELIEFTEGEDRSFSKILGKDNEIMRHEQSYQRKDELDEISSDYIENIAEKIICSSGAKKVLKLDISNCFSSFYMHMIPAIILGYNGSNNEYNKSIKNLPTNEIYQRYSKLDTIIRKQNLNRTNGLLTGPLIPKIITEAMLTRIDKDLIEKKILYSRYMDDYEVYIYDEDEKEVISIFTRVLKKYGFTLNYEKTEIVEFPYYLSENLEKIFKGYVEKELDNSDLMELFNEYLKLEQNGTKGAIRYLLKSLEKVALKTENQKLYKSYLITIIQNNERSLIKACMLLINNKDEMLLDEKDIKVIKEILKRNIELGYDLEVVWLLYLLLETNKIVEDDSTIQEVSNSNNELAQTLLLCRNMLITQNLSQVEENASSWILLYELYVKDYIDEDLFVERLNLNKNKEMYRKFKTDNIHFCE